MPYIPGEPYYLAYDARYRSVYAQGVEYWSAFPDEIAGVCERVGRFLADMAWASPPQIIEFGCGEAYLGEYLAGRGDRYTGVDIAVAAIEKARRRLAPFGDAAQAVCGSILGLYDFADASFDVGVDVSCLHMLLVDADRERYLREVHRVLRPGAWMLFLNESHRPDASSARITDARQWLEMTGLDHHRPQPREAWQDGKRVTVHLPLLPARPRSEEQYRQELQATGFQIIHSDVEATLISLTARA